MDAALAAHLDSIERFRAEQARLLHGELGGLLSAARMVVATLGATPDADALARLDRQLAEALALKQRVVDALRPGLLDHFGPGVALSAHFETQCRSAGVAFDADVPFGLPLPAAEDGILLYRIGESVLALALRQSVRAIALSAAAESGLFRLRMVAEGASLQRDAASELDLLGRWIAQRGGSLQCRTEDETCIVEAGAPLA